MPAIPPDKRSSSYREKKTQTHTRVSPWFIARLISEIDKRRGKHSRAAWVLIAVQEKLKRKKTKSEL